MPIQTGADWSLSAQQTKLQPIISDQKDRYWFCRNDTTASTLTDSFDFKFCTAELRQNIALILAVQYLRLWC